MNVAEWILVAFLSVALLCFLIVAIVLAVKLIHLAVEYIGKAAETPERELQQKVDRYIDEHMEEEIHRADLANHVYLNPDYLNRVFKQITGKSLKEYVILRKMEMARKFARRFNSMYGVDFFPEPESFSMSSKALKVPGLDGTGKMGKSDGNCIYIKDTPEEIKKKVMKAVTDSGPVAPNSEKPEVIQNLFTMLEIVSAKDTYDYFNEKWNDCSIRYGDLKKQLAADIAAAMAPIRERIEFYSKDVDLLDRIAKTGAEKARESAAATLREVRGILGFRK